MFDILAYLFENYDQADACPEPRQLARKLSAAGFDDKEIGQAIDWLAGLRRKGPGALSIAAQSGSVRCYTREEQARLGSEGLGFLLFLESAGVLNALTREQIVEGVMSASGMALSLTRLKLIVLMVLWNRNQPLDTLILEELLSEKGEAVLH